MDTLFKMQDVFYRMYTTTTRIADSKEHGAS